MIDESKQTDLKALELSDLKVSLVESFEAWTFVFLDLDKPAINEIVLMHKFHDARMHVKNSLTKLISFAIEGCS